MYTAAMGVAAHLGIRLSDYDRRIRTFIPAYDELIDAAAGAVPPGARTIVDLGIGTGALAERCARRARRAHVVGIDADDPMLSLAAQRLGARASLAHGDLLRAALPESDAVVASFARHHIRTERARLRLFRRIRDALSPGGVLIVGDCYPARDRRVAAGQRQAWIDHLRVSYSSREAGQLLQAWGREDVYVPLERELALMRRAGFHPEVIWRRGMFAVVLGTITTEHTKPAEII